MALYLEVTGVDETLQGLEKVKSLLNEAETTLFHLRPVIGLDVRTGDGTEDGASASLDNQ